MRSEYHNLLVNHFHIQFVSPRNHTSWNEQIEQVEELIFRPRVQTEIQPCLIFSALWDLNFNFRPQARSLSCPPASLLFISRVCVCVCVCVHFVPSLQLFFALPCRCLFVDFLASGGLPPSLPPSSSSLSVALPVVGCAPSSLLPPCSLIPPSPSLFGCHLVSYVRGMGGEWLWRFGAIRQTSRRSLALPCVCCGGSGVFSPLAGWSQRATDSQGLMVVHGDSSAPLHR